MDNKIFESITKEILGWDTLETRRSDSLDFHDISVWRMKEALEAAYKLGCKNGAKSIIDGFIGETIPNDGKELGRLLKDICKNIKHMGNFEFEGETFSGEKVTISTKPTDEDFEYIEITGIK